MNTRKLSDKQEKRLARNIGGRQVIGSGSTPFLKGDVITSDLFIEAKTKAVESKSISVKKAWLEKAQEQAYSMRKKDYTELDGLIREGYADTCDRDNLILRCKERGITPYPATAAVLKGEFNVDIGVGQRFSLDELNYISKKYIGRGNPTEEGGSGTYLYQMECETVGTDGNKHFGDLTAIEFITNLEIARLTEVLIPAEDEEDTEVLRARYFSSFETAPFGGNKKDYKEKANKLNGVGDTKVIPAWDGGGTVKLIIINSDFDKASDTLVSEVQEAMDPLSDRGNGSGIAPIGHTVTVVTVKEVPITVSVNIVYKEGYSWSRLGEDIKAAIEAYLLEMRKDWANQSFLSVRITQVEARLLKIEGIVDISDTKINGVADNFTLASDEIPVPSETGVVVDA